MQRIPKNWSQTMYCHVLSRYTMFKVWPCAVVFLKRCCFPRSYGFFKVLDLRSQEYSNCKEVLILEERHCTRKYPLFFPIFHHLWFFSVKKKTLAKHNHCISKDLQKGILFSWTVSWTCIQRTPYSFTYLSIYLSIYLSTIYFSIYLSIYLFYSILFCSILFYIHI